MPFVSVYRVQASGDVLVGTEEVSSPSMILAAGQALATADTLQQRKSCEYRIEGSEVEVKRPRGGGTPQSVQEDEGPAPVFHHEESLATGEGCQTGYDFVGHLSSALTELSLLRQYVRATEELESGTLGMRQQSRVAAIRSHLRKAAAEINTQPLPRAMGGEGL